MGKFSKSPFFIVGSPRSGTTLLQTLLDGNSALSIPPESHIFDRFGELFEAYGDLNQPACLKIFVGDLLGDERIKRWELNITPEDFCRSLESKSLPGIISHLFELYAQRHGKSRWGDKTPEHTFCLEQIHLFFPQALFIHLIRDGRDVAESLGRMFFGPVTIDRKALLWKKHLNAFEIFEKRYPNLCLTVHYEELVHDPSLILRRILNFMGESSSEVSLQIPDTSLKQVYLKTDDSTHRSLGEAVTDKKVGIYKQKLKPREIEIFEAIAGDELAKNGYPLESSGKESLHPGEKFLFFLIHQTRFLKKLSHFDYVRDRLQYHLRKFTLKIRGGR